MEMLISQPTLASKPFTKVRPSNANAAGKSLKVTSAAELNVSNSRMLLILDNYIHSEPEPEDELLVRFGILQQLMDEARELSPVQDWERLLDEL